MAAEVGLECEVLDEIRMRQLGMGSLLGVAQGSAEPPALIIVRYKPATAPKTKDHLGLVGKGVTFDTGGISIKPAEGMEKMKYDMAGGAAMLGAMRAIAQLKPAIPVTALVPAVENMVGSRAQRPGDIVTSLSGKTIEVLNTDAEGRLILVDALTYAQRLGCTHLVDAATLTGAIVVALGHVNIGVFTNNDALLARVLAAAKAEGEKSWHMPLDDDYKDLLKSAFADLANIGGRWGGAISAAYFLKEFAGDTPWVHLDIAGTAWLDEAKPYLAKGPRAWRADVYSSCNGLVRRLQARFSPVSRADAIRVRDIGHENLAVAQLAGARRRHQFPDNLFGAVLRHHHLDFELRQQVHFVFDAAVNLAVALLPAVAAPSKMVMPSMPISARAAFTSSSLCGWMIASIFFMSVSLAAGSRY